MYFKLDRIQFGAKALRLKFSTCVRICTYIHQTEVKNVNFEFLVENWRRIFIFILQKKTLKEALKNLF